MALGDDIIIAGVGAVLSGGAAIYGARIGARSTRETALNVFKLRADQEDATWREALLRECELNLTRSTDLSLDDLYWSFDSQVLSESLLHSSAFTADALQRIIWIRQHNDKVEATLAFARERRAGQPGALPQQRQTVLGEIQALYNILNG